MKLPTKEQYRSMVREMPVKELVSLADTFNSSQTLKPQEVIICNIINDEVERRIANWEMCQV